jgi:hypothetical protein
MSELFTKIVKVMIDSSRNFRCDDKKSMNGENEDSTFGFVAAFKFQQHRNFEQNLKTENILLANI